MLEALLTSTTAVAIAEIGDKTQLLSLFLISRYPRQYLPIITGIVVATLVNHALSAWLGAWLGSLIPTSWHPWLVGGSFVAVALWLLIPDKEDDEESSLTRYGALVATTVLFFLAEIGDKTQIATVVLAANYSDTWAVIAGTTIGMLLANVPVIAAGGWILERLPMDWIRRAAFALFLVLGLITIAQAL